MDPKMEQNKVSLESLVDAAVREDWKFVDEKINEFKFTEAVMGWAIHQGLQNEDQNIRDLAATLLDKSPLPIDSAFKESLKKQMTADSYHIVRFRLAIALYKRGDRSPEVTAMMTEAKKDSDVGELAGSYLK